MGQTSIPFIFMRGGSSRAPYFLRSDLPSDECELSATLLAVIGSGHPLNIDGIGGGASVTTKVAMLSAADDEWADVDYYFAQVGVLDRQVDYRPTCGNILAGVGPAALELGLAAAKDPVTELRIRAVNTGARVLARVQTPGGRVNYAGDYVIDGVPGSAAPVALEFMDVVGSLTGALLPTGNSIDVIDGIEVSCVDVAMPVVIARAADLGLSGYEGCDELSAKADFMARLETIRRRAGELMGLGDVSKSVVPKFALVAAPQAGGTLCARYFVPDRCHPSMAVTGAQCLAACALAPNTVAHQWGQKLVHSSPATLRLEHPGGVLEVVVSFSLGAEGISINSAGLIRSARKLAAGEVFVPESAKSIAS